mgnify:CR=1 FL=1
MIYRRLDANGDYVFGQGRSQFISGSEAVAQAVITNLKLLLGEWWEDVNNGLPLWQSILGIPGSEANQLSIDNIIKDRILKTNLNGELLVNSIDDYTRTYNATTRVYTFEAVITTIYSESVVIKEQLSIG